MHFFSTPVKQFISCIGFLYSRIEDIFFKGVDDFERTLYQVGGLYRENKFHTLVKISLHPVGRTHIYFGLTAVFKNKDTAVFEELSDNAVNGDIFADTLYIGD